MQNEVDPFEEFEFKPITDGLGFHRNQKPLNEKAAPLNDQRSSMTHSSKQTKSVPGKSFSGESAASLFSTPLPNKKSNMVTTVDTSNTSDMDTYQTRASLAQGQTHDIVDEILKNIETSKQKANQQFEIPKNQVTKVITSKAELVYKASGPLATAMFLDLMLVVASSLLFLVALLAITKIDLLQNIRNPDDQGTVYISLFLLFCSVGFIYYVTFRSLLGYTPGEWAYDQKVQVRGDKVDFFALTKIALRSILIMISGGFIVPLVSWAFDRDFLGEFLDLPLVRRK
jgi:uncharacterized RDD family membrane protein YckC